MEVINLHREIIFGSADSATAQRISELEKQGKLRKIAPRLYSTNMKDSPESIVRRNLIEILVWRFPNAIISHRSAYEMRPTQSGNIFLTSTQNRRITDLPGICVNLIKGHPALSSDIPYMGIFISSESRWMLEILQSSRKSSEDSKSLPQTFVEERLEKMLLQQGEDKLNAFRDQCRSVAQQLDLTKEFDKLNKIISALLSTHKADILQSPSAAATAAGEPYDPSRLELFDVLFEQLNNRFYVGRPVRYPDEESFRMFAFFESYFSNYIEGTEFVVDEAKEIIDSGLPKPRRDEDSHDILGTYRIVSNQQEMSKVPHSKQELFELLRNRHAVLLQGRPSMQPGMFKQMNNRAGDTVFVDAQLVQGTLAKGFQRYEALQDPVARAIFMMFMISEVHPFNDGNGRMARIMMNAELVHADQCRIIVPTVFRLDYLLTLRKLSRQKNPEAYIQVMQKLHAFSQNLYGSDYDALNKYLLTCNAYEEPENAHLIIADRQD